MTGVLIWRRKYHMKKQTHRKNAKWWQRQRLEWYSHKPPNIKDWRPPLEARKGRKSLPYGFQMEYGRVDSLIVKLKPSVMREWISVMFSHPVGGMLLQQPRENTTGLMRTNLNLRSSNGTLVWSGIKSFTCLLKDRVQNLLCPFENQKNHYLNSAFRYFSTS